MITVAASSFLMLICLAAALPTPPSTRRNQQQPEPTIQHHYVRQLFRCLKLLNNEVDLSTGDHACVPEVFSSPEDVPSSEVADKTISTIAINSTLVTNTTLHLDFQVSTPLDCLRSVHVRLYKSRLQSILQQQLNDSIGTNCNLQNGVNSTISILTDSKEVVMIQRKTITYEDLVLEKQWMDFTVPIEDIKSYNILKDKEAMIIFNIETETCPGLSISDMGIETQEPGREPVLTLFEKTNPTEEFRRMEEYARTIATSESERKRRAFEGSGIAEVDHPCDLIKHDATLEQFGLDGLFGSNGFSMNYCSGHCKRPLGGNPPFHTMVLAKIQEDDPLPTRAPCCVPTKYVSIVSYMFDGTAYIMKSIKNASAVSCGCR